MRRLFALPALLAAAVVLAPSALAHANLVSTSPQDGAILGTAPTEVRVRFDDSVSAGPGNAVVANGGGSVLAGRPRVAESGRELVLPLKRLGDGDYSVRWRIVSDDGHLEEGVLAFRVGSAVAGGAPKAVFAAQATRPSLADLLSRWLYLGGILVAGGTALFWLLVFRVGARRSAQTFMLSLSAAALGGSWLLYLAHAGDTRFARVTTVSVVIAAGGAAVAAVSTRYPRLLVVAGGASLALLVAPSLAGHALDPNGARVFSVAADLVHVVAAAFWIGGLVQLALLLRAGEDTGVVRRFSRLALPAVVLIALAGGGRALVELSAVSQLWSTGYGRTIVFKTALFAVLLVLAWLSRGRLDSAARMLPSVTNEVALLALVVGAVALLTALRPGRDEAAARPKAIAPVEAGRPMLPPRGSVVLARESRELAVALAVRPGRPLELTATVIGQTGRGVDGLDVELVAARERSGASNAAQSCGHGCYSTTLAFANPTRFAVNIAGKGRFRSVAFPLPGPWPPPAGSTFLRRASRTFRALDSAVYLERLASGPRRSILATWKLEAPNRVEYAIHGGAGGIVIGSTRWDRVAPGADWVSSRATPLPQPVPLWGLRTANAHVLHQTPGRMTLSWLDPDVPAWFTGTFDRKTALPVEVRMTAAAHFMLQRYLSFNGDVRIRPPG